MNYLALAAMVRNEAPYLEEWVKYHHAIGFEQFYIYENDSIDNTVDVLDYLTNEYPIKFVSVSGKAIINKVYDSCIKEYNKDNRWIMFSDIDEFLVCHAPLTSFLKDYEEYPALTVHWRVFGSNGHVFYRDIPVIERFTMRSSTVDKCCKSIVDPSRTGKCFTSHRFDHPLPPVDERYVPIKHAHTREDEVTADLIQLNHYATKSYQECLQRRASRRLSTGVAHKSAKEYFEWFDKNEVEDKKAYNIWMDIID